MYNSNLKKQKIIDYTDKIVIKTHFNENGKDLNVIIRELVLNNCNPINRKKLEL